MVDGGGESCVRFGQSPRVAREIDVDEHIAAGRVTVHDDSQAFLAHLDRLDVDTEAEEARDQDGPQ